MSIILQQPVSLTAGCIPCCWRDSHDPCNFKKILITARDSGDIGETITPIGIRMSGRSLYSGGTYGCGSDEYITFTETGSPHIIQSAYIDIWRAFKDGIWSSSTTIGLYINVYWCFFSEYTIGDETYSCYSKVTDSFHGSLANPNCPAGFELVKTITVNANGTYSIA